MPAAHGGKRQQKHQESEHRDMDIARQLILKQEGEEYALIYKELGNRTFYVYCFDGKDRRAVVPKSVRYRLGAGSVVLVVKREYATNDEIVDIEHAYYKDEIKQLIEFGHIQGNLDAIMESKRGGESTLQYLKVSGKKKPDEAESEPAVEEKVDVDDL